jgi:hypothetical protein
MTDGAVLVAEGDVLMPEGAVLMPGQAVLVVLIELQKQVELFIYSFNSFCNCSCY